MYEPPTMLELYLKEFAMPGDESVVLMDGQSVIQCNGFGCGLHSFMAAKGVAMCTKCHDFSVN